jgi:phosphoribosylaminoimidazolecarboxamide formyltransferase/IMP cyclohydrolase
MQQLAEQGLQAIDLVAVNLYPFEAIASRPEVEVEEAIENIDIGGPAMIRAAAKNHASVLVVVDSADYGPVLESLKAGEVAPSTRRQLAATAYAHTAAYDSAIAGYMRDLEETDGWPRQISVAGTKVQDLRYGENPHQVAALYRRGIADVGVAGARQLQGIELSYNNIVDVDAAWELVQDLPTPTSAPTTATRSRPSAAS